MTCLKNELLWNLQQTPRGAKITVMADNKEALDAVHEFKRLTGKTEEVSLGVDRSCVTAKYRV
jgi:hypothetical protein